MRRQLYTDKDDREIFSTIQDQLRRIEKRMEDGRAALQHLEMALINVACDDPGAAIGAQLVLPLLQVLSCSGLPEIRPCCVLALIWAAVSMLCSGCSGCAGGVGCDEAAKTFLQ